MVALVPVGVGLGELDQRAVERVRRAEVGGDRDPVAGAGVRPGQRPAAEPPVVASPPGSIALDVGEPFQSRSWRT